MKNMLSVLAGRSFRASKMRNLIAVLAIMLTAILFTTVTTIGMGAILLNGCQIGKNCMVAAGALVTQNAVIPDGSLVMGTPAKVVRPLRPEELEGLRHGAEEYRMLSEELLSAAGKQV